MAEALLALFMGYAAVLATPGPNMLAIGGIAATRGFARAVPICLGLVVGATSLAGAMDLIAAVGNRAEVQGGDTLGRVLGAALLAWLAVSQARCGDAGASQRVAGGGIAFCAGYCTAATNPLTIAFFAAQLAAGPLGGGATGWAVSVAALLGVAATALVFYLGMAALMAHPVARHAVLSWQRPIRLASAGALMMSAATMLRPLLFG
jgi:threonine/homoserine/homoserine lactone efflux protein